MAEYIKREALRKTFEKWRSHHEKLDDDYGVQIMEDVIWELNAQPAADVAPVGWISVRDKLPEPEQDVLVIAHGWSNRLLYIGSYQRVEAETSWLTGVTSKASDWSLWGWSYLREPEVTHWMPLPDPPKDTETEESA